MVRVQAIRVTGGTGDLSYEPAKSWKDDALCVVLDNRYFEYTTDDDPGYKPLIETDEYGKKKVRGQRRTNEALLGEGSKVCSSCPVSQQCLSESSPADLFWTVRGGQLPSALTVRWGKAPVQNENEWIGEGYGTGFRAGTSKGDTDTME